MGSVQWIQVSENRYCHSWLARWCNNTSLRGNYWYCCGWKPHSVPSEAPSYRWHRSPFS